MADKDNLEAKIDSIVGTLKNFQDTSLNNSKIINNNFEILNKKIEALDNNISLLHEDTNQGFDEVKLELVKIQTTTNYEDLYENLKVVGKQDS